MMTAPEGGSQCLRIPATRAERQEWEARLGAMPIVRHLGASLDLHDAFVVRLHLRHAMPAHYGGLGTRALNGAMIAGLFDCAMSVAGILHFRGRTCGTLHLSIDFMKPVRSAYPTVECRAVRKSHNVAFLEACVIERGGRRNASATGIVGIANLKQSGDADTGQANWLKPYGVADQAGAPGCASNDGVDATEAACQENLDVSLQHSTR